MLQKIPEARNIKITITRRKKEYNIITEDRGKLHP